MQSFRFHFVDHPVDGFRTVVDPSFPFLFIHEISAGGLFRFYDFPGNLINTFGLLIFGTYRMIGTAAGIRLGAGGEHQNISALFHS